MEINHEVSLQEQQNMYINGRLANTWQINPFKRAIQESVNIFWDRYELNPDSFTDCWIEH